MTAKFTQEESNAFQNLVPVRFSINEDDPLELVQFTALLMAHLETPQEITFALVEFTEPEILEHISKQPQNFYLVGLIWLNAVKHLIKKYPASAFPYEMLNLPLMFQEWNWQYDLTAEWKEIYQTLLARAEELPPSIEEHVHLAVQLFCIESIFRKDTPSPFEAMTQRLQSALPARHCNEALISMGMILGRNGWLSGY